MLAATVTRGLRSSCAALLYYTGVLRLFKSMSLRRRAVVLMYHRVLSDAEREQTASHPSIVVRRETFAKQMAELKRCYRVLSIDEFAGYVASGRPFPSGSCLITFDDGWADNFRNAFPILRDLGLPAVVFLPVNFINSDRMFWRETLTAVLVRAVTLARTKQERKADIHNELSRVGLAAVLEATGADVRDAVSERLAGLKDVEPSQVREIIARLSAALGAPFADRPRTDAFMTWAEIDEMSRHGVAFGGHGAEHVRLTRVSAAQADREIGAAREVLVSRCAESLPTFSYPNGDWSPAVALQVRGHGFRLAFTTQPGRVRSSDDPFALRRVNIHEDMTATMPLFMARVVGLF